MTGNGNDGTLVGTQFFSDGTRGKSFWLDGTQDYMTVPNMDALDDEDSFAVGGWIYSHGTQSSNGASLFWNGESATDG